jgi:hypothetical protein
MNDETLTSLEIDGRLDELEKRVASDLGDGRSNGNVWRTIKELTDENTKLKETLTELLRKQKEANDKYNLRVAQIEDALEKGKLTITKLEEINQLQSKQIAELVDLDEKQQRHIDALADRLNGRGLVQVDPYEKVVSQVRQILESLQGGEGQLSFPQVRNSIQQTQFLGRVLYGAIGLFGVGAVSAAGLTLFGGEKIAPEVKALQDKVQDATGEIKTLRDRFDADLARRLEQAGKK